jgi:hypothetical protein
MHMVGQQVPFLDLAFLTPSKLVEYSAQVPPDLTKQRLLAVLRREHDMEIAMSQDHNHLNHATWECKYLEGLAVPPRRSYDFLVPLPKP